MNDTFVFQHFELRSPNSIHLIRLPSSESSVNSTYVLQKCSWIRSVVKHYFSKCTKYYFLQNIISLF